MAGPRGFAPHKYQTEALVLGEVMTVTWYKSRQER